MNPEQIRLAIKLGSIAAMSIALFSSGWLVHGWKFDSDMRAKEQATNDAYHAAVDKANTTSAKLESVLEKLEANKFITVKETSHEILKPVYSDCVLPVSGVRLYNKSASSDPGKLAD
jgi:hypothetical protein